ncbi:TolC family protein, partial [candidate division KSB1 bacterium]|nr:TolC family protein [candidate division KSB1 bacterium]NIR68654.1 TolC family protein [candidate division KSB1 bacterium]NIS27143.1 TolC family protein [candidate division KSB1 bacterium]NIT74029.1 TolC family protein [candidate division KSB1 bacterium]NIU27895.1 TolC family protein [candidate division KSB1 bacterium]
LGLEISKAKLTRAKHAKILPRFELRNVWGPSPRARGELAPSGGFVISPDTATSIPGDLRYFTELDVDLLQPIFTFGRLSGATKAASFGVEAEEANVLKEKGKVRFQVRQLYWAFVLGKELLAVVQDADEELTKAENKVEKQLDEGSDEVSQTDLFKLQIFRYDINERLREARGKRDLTDSALKTTLGLEDDVGIEVATEYLEPLDVRIDSLDVYYEMAYRNRPELSQLRAGISARRALVNVRKSEYFPQFFLGAEIKYNFAEDRFDPNNPFIYNPTNFFRPGIVAGINLNLNFWQTRDKVRIAQAEYLQLAQKEKLLLDGIKLDVQRVYIELRQVARNMRDSRRALKASENWLRSTSMTFDIGVGDVKELIDAFKANGAMQAKHLENIFKYNVAIAKLGKAVGKDLYPDELIKE